jgi:hypothetical protein
MTEAKKPTREEIERRAHELYLARGGDSGSAVADWLEAEKQLTGCGAVSRRYADTAKIIEILKGIIADHRSSIIFVLFGKHTGMAYSFGYGGHPQEFLAVAENLCAAGYDFWGGAVSEDCRNWGPFRFNLCRSNCPIEFINSRLDQALIEIVAQMRPGESLISKLSGSVITPSTKLMTLFKWRRIGRGVRESNS